MIYVCTFTLYSPWHSEPIGVEIRDIFACPHKNIGKTIGKCISSYVKATLPIVCINVVYVIY